MADRIDIPQKTIKPRPSVADVLQEFNELDLPVSLFAGSQPLDDKSLEVLRRVEGYANPEDLAGTLTSALRVLWVARKTGELADEDTDATLWLLAEAASLLEHAIDANQAVTWFRAQHEKAVARADQKAEEAPV